MLKSRSIALGAVALFIASPEMASAACLKDGPLVCGSGRASIASGAPLEVSRGGDFAALGSGSALKGGDRVLVGASDATLQLGPACQAAVGPGSLVSIRHGKKGTCALVTEQTAAGAPIPPGPAVNPLLVGGVAVAGAAALAAGIALSNNGGNGGGGSVGTVSSR